MSSDSHNCNKNTHFKWFQLKIDTFCFQGFQFGALKKSENFILMPKIAENDYRLLCDFMDSNSMVMFMQMKVCWMYLCAYEAAL